MGRLLSLAVTGAFCVSLLMVGAAQAVCDPLCSPNSNKSGAVRGLDRADAMAGGGADGRANAREKQGLVPVVTLPPDGDLDGVPDADDQCLTEKGPASNGGCPVVELPPPGA